MAKMAKKAETARKVTISAQKSAALMQQVKVRDEAYTNLRNEVSQKKSKIIIACNYLSINYFKIQSIL